MNSDFTGFYIKMTKFLIKNRLERRFSKWRLGQKRLLTGILKQSASYLPRTQTFLGKTAIFSNIINQIIFEVFKIRKLIPNMNPMNQYQ